MEKLLTVLEVVSFEQKRLAELENLLQTMRLIAYEAIMSDEKRLLTKAI
ncbi:hypothetical protein [Exiguobacterium sp. JLM-2]|nr:hypothetical protein [Exiguobacterium sp. JLM-2]